MFLPNDKLKYIHEIITKISDKMSWSLTCSIPKDKVGKAIGKSGHYIKYLQVSQLVS